MAAALMCFAAAEAKRLLSFEALMGALQEGCDVRMVVDYGGCDLYVGGEKADSSPQAVGGMPLDVFEYFSPGLFGNERGFLAFSHRSFISLRGRYVYNYVKVRVFDDGSVEINAQYLNPGTLDAEMDETFKTAIYDGSKGAAAFFAASSE